MTERKAEKIAIIGAGTIGLSFAALHLLKNPFANVTIYDTRQDLQQYVRKKLPEYLVDGDVNDCINRVSFTNSLEDAVRDADIVQEQGPENPAFKVSTWSKIEEYAPSSALFWSSTSGIPASQQSKDMNDRSRLLVVHPYNPPHIMPLLEVVPSPEASSDSVSRTLEYWKRLGRSPIVIRQECTGFVANRLAFAMLREACSLVTQGIVGVEELDKIVETSMGPRWAVAGPFKSYHAGGGQAGLKEFLSKLGGTIQNCWDASDEDVTSGDIKIGSSWQDLIGIQADQAYGVVDTAERDAKTKRVFQALSN